MIDRSVYVGWTLADRSVYYQPHGLQHRPRPRSSTPAFRLFYARGIRAVGVDLIIAESDVAKATLLQALPGQGRPGASPTSTRVDGVWSGQLHDAAEAAGPGPGRPARRPVRRPGHRLPPRRLPRLRVHQRRGRGRSPARRCTTARSRTRRRCSTGSPTSRRMPVRPTRAAWPVRSPSCSTVAWPAARSTPTRRPRPARPQSARVLVDAAARTGWPRDHRRARPRRRGGPPDGRAEGPGAADRRWPRRSSRPPWPGCSRAAATAWSSSWARQPSRPPRSSPARAPRSCVADDWDEGMGASLRAGLGHLEHARRRPRPGHPRRPARRHRRRHVASAGRRRW